jgi:hypothetical protein
MFRTSAVRPLLIEKTLGSCTHSMVMCALVHLWAYTVTAPRCSEIVQRSLNPFEDFRTNFRHDFMQHTLVVDTVDTTTLSPQGFGVSDTILGFTGLEKAFRLVFEI